MRLDFAQLIMRSNTTPLQRSELTLEQLEPFLATNAPAALAHEALATSQYHVSCREAGIDDGRRYFQYHINGERVGLCGYHQRRCDPPHVIWGGFFIASRRLPGAMKMRMQFDTLRHILQHTQAHQGYVETYAAPGKSNMHAIWAKLGAVESGTLKDFYGPGSDMCIQRIDLKALRTSLDARHCAP